MSDDTSKATAGNGTLEPQADAKAEPQAEAKPEPQAEAKPEPQAEAKPEPQAEAKPEPQADTKPEPQADTKPEPQVDAKPEPDTKPEPQAEAKPEPQLEGKSELQVEAKAGSDAATTAEPRAGAKERREEKIALLLLDIGEPENAADIKPFLKRLYGDPRMMRLPFGTELQKLFASFIAMMRAPKLSAALEGARGKAREREQLEPLLEALCAKLNADRGRQFVPVLGLRHASPSIPEAVTKARAEKCRRIVGLWARPFRSEASLSARAELALVAGEDQGLDVSVIDHYDDSPEARAVWGDLTRQAIESLPREERDDAHVLFALHGMPISGTVDPGLEEADRFARALVEAEGLKQSWSVAYACGTDPRASLLPTIEDELARLGPQRRAVVVVPLAHACETLLTRWEIDKALREAAKKQGIKHFARADCPAGRTDFTEALTTLVRRHVEQMDELRLAPAA
ncbi:MAG: ferrochelatase [Myxococcales bacterium]|jgi:ferrochelatase